MKALFNLSPVTTERKKLSDSVFDSLCTAIVEGTLSPGERLPEAKVAESMETSRMPVREALTELERRHLVQRDASGTCVVAEWDRQVLWEVATLRAALEGLVMRLAIPNVTAEDLDYLEGIAVQMDLALARGDYERLIRLDIQFHSYVWSRTGHRLLQETLEELKPQVRYFMYVTRPGDEETYPETHREVIAVLREGDVAEAEAVIREHTLSTAERAIARIPITGASIGSERNVELGVSG
jgi:DNA-binding GntR family transcriptional regulator